MIGPTADDLRGIRGSRRDDLTNARRGRERGEVGRMMRETRRRINPEAWLYMCR